jgi:hypothetical protein
VADGDQGRLSNTWLESVAHSAIRKCRISSCAHPLDVLESGGLLAGKDQGLDIHSRHLRVVRWRRFGAPIAGNPAWGWEPKGPGGGADLDPAMPIGRDPNSGPLWPLLCASATGEQIAKYLSVRE